MINRIFLDLDDVLCDFTLSALQHVGCPVGPRDFDKYDPKWQFDIIAAANALHDNGRIFTPDEFWRSLPRSFWAGVQPSGICYWLIGACVGLVERDNVFILTCPTRYPDCIAGKLEWIQRFLPSWLHQQFLIGKPKFLCASPESLLIDDSDENVYIFRKRGGHAILVPRPWNTNHSYSHITKEIIHSSLQVKFQYRLMS